MIYVRRVIPIVFQRGRGTTALSVTIQYDDETGRLSLSWNGPDGTGQCDFTLLDAEGQPGPGFSREMCSKLYEVWNRWHLNDMRAGTKQQEAAVREWKMTHKYDYKEVCKYLDSIGLLFDAGYEYGTGWLKEDVPDGVLKWLFTLPGCGDGYFDIVQQEIEENEFLALLYGTERGV